MKQSPSSRRSLAVRATPVQVTQAATSSVLDRYRRRPGDEQIIVRPPFSRTSIRRPSPTEFVRTQISEECSGPFPFLFDKVNDVYFAVPREYWDELGDHLVDVALVPTVNAAGRVFLWIIRRPDASGRIDTWNASAWDVASTAQTQWVRVGRDHPSKMYYAERAQRPLRDPDWQPFEFEMLLQAIDNGRSIDSLDHPVVRRLRGEW